MLEAFPSTLSASDISVLTSVMFSHTAQFLEMIRSIELIWLGSSIREYSERYGHRERHNLSTSIRNPIIHATTAKFGFNSSCKHDLCWRCDTVLDMGWSRHKHSDKLQYNHHSIRDLKVSVAQGCHLCAVIHDSLRPQQLEYIRTQQFSTYSFHGTSKLTSLQVFFATTSGSDMSISVRLEKCWWMCGYRRKLCLH
jgi:hypothetical protein